MRYENLVLSGKLTGSTNGNTERKDFSFFFGEHDKGYPWGDGETMSDVARELSAPIRELVFKKSGQQPSKLHKFVNEIIIRMMQ